MAHRSSLCTLILVLLYGCSSSGIVYDIEVQAQKHLATADTLERAAALKEATLEYQIVAEHFPSASVYATAVRKLGILFGVPENPVASDSASIYWLTTYLTLTQSPGEKQIIGMYLNVMDRMKTIRDSLERQTVARDSLTAVARKQASDAALRLRKVQELESELQKASTELKKLKEVDVRISKSRGKNKP